MIIQNSWFYQWFIAHGSILWSYILDVWERLAGAKQQHVYMLFGVSAKTSSKNDYAFLSIYLLVTGLIVANSLLNRESYQSLTVQAGFRPVNHFLFTVCWTIIFLLLYLNSNLIFRTEFNKVLTNRKYFLFSIVSLCSQNNLKGQLIPCLNCNFHNLWVSGCFPVCHSGLQGSFLCLERWLLKKWVSVFKWGC